MKHLRKYIEFNISESMLNDPYVEFKRENMHIKVQLDDMLLELKDEGFEVYLTILGDLELSIRKEGGFSWVDVSDVMNRIYRCLEESGKRFSMVRMGEEFGAGYTIVKNLEKDFPKYYDEKYEGFILYIDIS